MSKTLTSAERIEIEHTDGGFAGAPASNTLIAERACRR